MTAPPTPAGTGTTPPGSTDGPLIVACLRLTDLRPGVDPLDGAVTRDPLGVGLSPADAAALEHALRLADGWTGRVVAVCAGTSSVEPVLREVAALGVAVVRVPLGDERDHHRYVAELVEDERGLARTLVAAITPFGVPDLVLCGDRSVDRGTGALPVFLAHELGAAQAMGLVSVAAAPDGQALVCERRLDGGWRERLRVPLPAVCSVEGAGVRLRRASLVGALAAATAPVPVDRSLGVADAAGGPVTFHVGPTRPYTPRTHVVAAPDAADPRLRLLALTGALVAHEPPTVVHPADAAEAADALLAFLARHGYLMDATGQGDRIELGGGG
ncbi:MAG: mycofactocin-associated electron transfer flavoprotein beta subunit [Acidimicrobiales bacterium]|jgi:electron transfer flavoprotein beta subunit